jgi:hypothetical protein
MPRLLAPSPDFRYVSLEAGPSRAAFAYVGLVGAGAFLGTALGDGPGMGTVLGASAAATVGAASRLVRRRGKEGPERVRRGMAIVPWGVLLDFDDRARVLRWPAVTRVSVRGVHGRDGGTPFTRYSIVTVEAGSERFLGRASGSPPLDRLSAHLADYADEASHRIALDLDGETHGEGPSEPDAELVLAAARAYLQTSAAADRLGLDRGGYRHRGGPAAGGKTASVLGAVLADRTAREVDPRPFAAVVAAELGVSAVLEVLISLVQSPLPLLAAVAKVAATKLGVARSRVGSLDEVEAFLLRRDAEALSSWRDA